MVGLRVEREPHAEPELGVVLEQRVVPGRSAALGVHRPRGGRQVGAVDRRAAGGVGHDHPVAEQLGDELEVRRLAAAVAGERELEQRLEHLGALDRVVGDEAAVERRDRLEELPVRALGVAVGVRRLQVDRLVPDLGLALGRADVDADAAAGAVVGRHLDRDPVVDEVAGLELLALEARRGAGDGSRPGRPSSGWPRAGRPWRTCHSRCRSTDPRSGSRGRSPASRSAVVPVGNVPSTGNALTGSRSPRPAISSAVTFLTNSGASAGTTGGIGAPVATAAERAPGSAARSSGRWRRSCARRRPGRAWRRSSRRSP